MAARRAHQLRWPLGSGDALQSHWWRSPKGVAPEKLRSGKVVDKDAKQGRQASPVGDRGGLGGLRPELGKRGNLFNNIAKDRLALRVAALWGLCPL